MIISYDYGHMEGGQDTSAKGIIYEYAEIRKYGAVCVNVLQKSGHTLVNCTPPDGSAITLMESLEYRVNKANSSRSQLHVCFHINAFNSTAHGSEIQVTSDAGERYAKVILDEICKLGFLRRGINRPNLYVTRNTNMTAILIEPFFCDSKIDCSIYNPVNLGNAIAKGILNIIGSYISSTVYDIKYLQHELNVQFGAGLAEDGIVGPLTIANISKVIVRQGSQGNIIKWIQSHVGTNPDGIFGPNTSNAVKAFQLKHHLTTDGVIGFKTWNVLLLS